MESYGCDRGVGLPPGLDRQLTMCTHTFFNCRWVNDTTLIKTADRPEDYTTRYVNRLFRGVNRLFRGR